MKSNGRTIVKDGLENVVGSGRGEFLELFFKTVHLSQTICILY